MASFPGFVSTGISWSFWLKIFVAGHKGLVGSAFCRVIKHSYPNLELITAGRDELDLSDVTATLEFFERIRPSLVVVCAARVGGIHANNKFAAEFITQNLRIELNIVEAAHATNVNKLLFLGSSCVYPKFANQPIVEEELLSGELEKSNEPYAVAKIAGIKICESFNRQFGTDYRSIMPCNLYGPNDAYDDLRSHVIPALLKKFHLGRKLQSKAVEIWGDGTVMREFMFSEDLAEIGMEMLMMDNVKFWSTLPHQCSHVNVGTGDEITIRDLAFLIGEIVGFEGEILFDKTALTGTPRKLLDCSRLEKMGFCAKTSLADGLKATYSRDLDAISDVC